MICCHKNKISFGVFSVNRRVEYLPDRWKKGVRTVAVFCTGGGGGRLGPRKPRGPRRRHLVQRFNTKYIFFNNTILTQYNIEVFKIILFLLIVNPDKRKIQGLPLKFWLIFFLYEILFNKKLKCLIFVDFKIKQRAP